MESMTDFLMKVFDLNKKLKKAPVYRKTPDVYLSGLTKHRTPNERALTRKERHRRSLEAAALCSQSPGCVVIGRYGLVKYPAKENSNG